MSKRIPEKLFNCATSGERLGWIKRALLAGHTLTDTGLWLGGVDRPESAIATLRERGLSIEVTTKKVVDAADEEHDDLAWRLAGQVPPN